MSLLGLTNYGAPLEAANLLPIGGGDGQPGGRQPLGCFEGHEVANGSRSLPYGRGNDLLLSFPTLFTKPARDQAGMRNKAMAKAS